MNKLKLFISVGICSILFTGCGFEGMFGVGQIKYTEGANCIPADLKERIANRSYYPFLSKMTPEESFLLVHGYYEELFADIRCKSKWKCYDDLVESYNETIKKTKKLPTSIDEEKELRKQWNVCNKMPEWLETKLNGYISQNEAEASNFKKTWQLWLGGDIPYNKVDCETDKEIDRSIGVYSIKSIYATKVSCSSEYKKSEYSTILAVDKCSATKKAIQAIENDLIDLGNGKKAKCADLSYKDAQKCLSHFKSTYSKLYCTPADLKERLKSYNTKDTTYDSDYDIWFRDAVDKHKCDEWGIERYKEIVSKEKSLPTSLNEERKLESKWNICNAMPEWLESKLNRYIEQNKNDDKAYIEASKFKESWQSSNRLSGRKAYFSIYDTSISFSRIVSIYGRFDCRAIKVATKAIENDLIDLGNGKKAKCADLSYKDAKKCQSHFDSVYSSVYNKLKSEFDIQQERKKYEQKNKQ